MFIICTVLLYIVDCCIETDCEAPPRGHQPSLVLSLRLSNFEAPSSRNAHV